MTAAEIAVILEKLRVKPGGIGAEKQLIPGVYIGFYENPVFGQQEPYLLRIRRRDRTSSVYLLREDVYTKGRSVWRRDNTWRLTPATVERFALNLEGVLATQCATSST